MYQYRIATTADIEGILELQSQNLINLMSEEDKKYGFVTTPFTLIQIEQIMEQNGLFIALHNYRVVAYVFAASWDYFKQWEIFEYMISRFPELTFEGKKITAKNSFQYGPICISKSHRGRGIIFHIFEEMRKVFRKRYPIGITFINVANEVSTKAHIQKLGWQIIDRFEFNQSKYSGLAYPMNRSARQ